MARLYTYDDAHGNTRWVVERNGFNHEDYREFDTFSEAKVYQDYLQSIEDREKTLAQNEEIIANQKRLIEEQKRQNSRPGAPQFSRQILDPEYREWLQFQKETNPEYKRWKKEKEAEELKKKVERDAENARQAAKRAEEAAKIKAKQEEEVAKKKNVIKLNQEKIAPLELDFLNRKKLTWGQRVQIAKYTESKKIINKLKYDNSKKVLDALLLNPFITGDVISTVHRRQQVAAEKREIQNKIKQESKGGCLGIVLILFTTSIATFLCLCI